MLRRKKQAGPEIESPSSGPKVFGSVNEASPEFVGHLARVLGDKPGKFVRVGEMVLLGSAELEHPDFVDKALENQWAEGLREKLLGAMATSAAQEGILDKTGVMDAGKFMIGEYDGAVSSFDIFGVSGNFGAGRPEERDRTVAAMEAILGQNVDVRVIQRH